MAEQLEFWNGSPGERWAASQVKIDRSLAAITTLALQFAAPRRGERALDIGCGCGTTTHLLHELTGSASGVDISGPMLHVARRRFPELAFVEADAATRAFTPDHDLVFSRFGVMFFADPALAFANLRTAGGRLAFVCWRAAAANLWAVEPIAAARDLLPPPEPVDPVAPGPFAFAEASHVTDILARDGYRDIVLEPRDTTVTMGASRDEAVEHALTIGPLARAAQDSDAPVRQTIRDRLAALFDRVGLALPAAIWLVGARAQ